MTTLVVVGTSGEDGGGEGPPRGMSACPDLLGGAHARRVGERVVRGTGPDALHLVTISTTPAAWTVSNFLSDTECDAIEAADPHLVDSITENDVTRTTAAAGGTIGPPASFDSAWAARAEDLTRDSGRGTADAEGSGGPGPGLTLADVMAILGKLLDMPRATARQARRVLTALDADGDGRIVRVEWADNPTGWRKVRGLVQKFRRNAPAVFSRYSSQGYANELPERVVRRLAVLLGLPVRRTVEAYRAAVPAGTPSDEVFGEAVQVVRYDGLGHYLCHLDSDGADGGGRPEDTPLRVYTVLFQLRTLTPDQGGGTWFPAAVRNTTDRGDSTVERRPSWQAIEELCEANNSCRGDTGVVVPSVRGTALVWLNHRSLGGRGTPWDPSGHLGPVDRASLHSGCDVAPGAQKWIATQWVLHSHVETLCRSEADGAEGTGSTDEMRQLWIEANAAALAAATHGDGDL